MFLIPVSKSQYSHVPIVDCIFLLSKIFTGTPYIGASAGTNATCPTMQTTNDMPNVWPSTSDTLGIIPFQINVHQLIQASLAIPMQYLPNTHTPHLELSSSRYLPIKQSGRHKSGQISKKISC